MGGKKVLGPSISSTLQKHALLYSQKHFNTEWKNKVQKQSYLPVRHIFLEE